jgi:NAD dependent epimerase/dehydratase family enzyme
VRNPVSDVYSLSLIALELMLGDAAKVVLEGQEVLPKRTLVSGFKFEYPKLKEALEQIFSTPY